MIQDPKSAGVVVLVLLWWIANGLTSLYAKTEMSKSPHNKTFAEMKWLDLTLLQFLFGVVCSAFWICLMERKSLRVHKIQDLNYLTIILGNLFGHLSVNVSYTFVSSSATQVVKSSEPIFMFLFLVCLRSKLVEQKTLTAGVLFSITLMALGTFLFVLWDITFNAWGIIAAVVSNIAFPLRNIALKNIGQKFGSPFQKYFILSLYGILLLLPLVVLKLIIRHSLPMELSQAGFEAASFHCVYNLASIAVLQTVSPLSHAILNFSKRIFVISLNIVYFDLAMTWQMFVGLAIIFLGLGIYLTLQTAKTNFPVSSLVLQSSNIFRCPKVFNRVFLPLALLFFLSTFVYFSPQNDATTVRRFSRIEDVTASRVSSEVLASTWLFNTPVSNAFTRSIVTARKKSGASVRVYCGTRKCLKSIRSLNESQITATFLVVPDVLEKTPLKEWGERHVLFKIVTGLHYEWFLTKALCLAHLWLYGGRFYLPPYQMNRDENTWPCLPLNDINKASGSSKNVSLLPGDNLVKEMMEQFLRSMDSWDSKTMPDDFRDTVWSAFSRTCPNGTDKCLIRNTESFRDFYARKGLTFHDDPHFGVLSPHLNVGPIIRGNIGDQIQGIASAQFLPFIDFFMDRDFQVAPDTHGKHVVFFNAWWGTRRVRWPPAKNIDPVMVSIHASEKMQSVISASPKIVDFLKSREPIGALDAVTKNFMEKQRVRSFVSGCMTLFLQIRSPQPLEDRDNKIYITDLSDENMKLLPESIFQKGELVEHDSTFGRRSTLVTQERFVAAYKILEKYSRAKLVITQRLHAALPCVAMGTPVIFINAHNMSGDGATKANGKDRFAGLVDLFHTIDLHSLTVKQAKRELAKFNWKNPPRNPNLGLRMQRVSSMWFILRKKTPVYESARRYGMLPLTPEWLKKVEPSRVFHIIHKDDSNRGLNWYQWRCIESILLHHPTSQLFFHSNAIKQSVFNVLTEVGFRVTLMGYKISELIEELPFKIQLGKLAKASSEKTLHDYGALKLLLLYKYGGIYLSENTIALKDISISQINVLSLDSDSNVNPWMLNFEKNHEFLRDALAMFPSMHNLSMKSDEGKALLTKVWNTWKNNARRKDTINISKKNSFYNLVDTSQKQSKFLHEKVSVIRIPDVGKCVEKGYEIDDSSTKLLEGTICKQIYNVHCLFCSNQY